jgi:hypothetical protein
MTFATRGSSPNMMKLQLFVCQFLFHFLSRPSSGTRRSIFHPYASNDVVCDKKVSVGGFVDEKILSGGVPLPSNFQRAFCMQIEKVE